VGPGEAHDRLSWDDPEMAALLAGERTGGPIARAIGAAELVVAWTRGEAVREALDSLHPRVLRWDPAPPPEGPHASEWLARALLPLGLDVRPAPPPLAFTEEELREARRATVALPPGFLALHPGSGSPSKNWPFSRFVEAARRLARDAPWLLLLGPAEAEVTAPPEAVVARGWPLRRLAAAVSAAGLFVGNDSGASHLAAAAGAPTLALFGPTDPLVWAPLGRAVSTLRTASGRLEDLATDAVVEAARALRSRAPERPRG
jgi:ADP-heptose:LPS heptosyltransferase